MPSSLNPVLVELIRRVPPQEAPYADPHIRTLLDPIVGAGGISWTEALNGEGNAVVSFSPHNQTDAIKEVLRDLDAQGLELDIHVGGDHAFRGPVVGLSFQRSGEGTVCQLHARGPWHYMRRAWLRMEDTLSYEDTDQVLIAKGLIDDFQGRQWANFGLDTSGMVGSGVLRDRVYVGAEGHNVGQRVQELAAIDRGFDFFVGPDLAVQVGEPLGTDKTGLVILDSRNISNPSASFWIGAEDLVAYGYASSPQEDGTFLTSTSVNTAVRNGWGRTGLFQSFQDVTRQDTIDDHAKRISSQRSDVLYVPAPEVFPVDLDVVSGIMVGDTVSVVYDYGLGLHEASRRVSTLTVSVDNVGAITGRVTLV